MHDTVFSRLRGFKWAGAVTIWTLVRRRGCSDPVRFGSAWTPVLAPQYGLVMANPGPGRKQRTGRSAKNILLVVLFAALASFDAACATLGRKLAFPGLMQGDPRAVLPASPNYELIPLRTKDGTKIIGQFGKALEIAGRPSADSAHAPTVLCFYGSGQHLSAPSNQKLFNDLRGMGVNVFIPEFPGYGMSDGSPSESQYYATADASLDYLLSRPDIDHGRIIAAGRSLGTGTAFDLASRRKLAGLISVGGFTTTADALAGLVKWLPRGVVNSIAADCRFDNLAKIKSVSCPILLVYGVRDTLIPPWMADRLANEAVSPVTKLPVPTEHNSLWKSAATGLNQVVYDWMHAR